MSMLLGMQDTTAAVEEASKLIETNPFEPNYMILKGNLFDVINLRIQRCIGTRVPRESLPDPGRRTFAGRFLPAGGRFG